MKRIVPVLLAVAVVVAAYSCGETEPPANRAPRAVGSIPAQDLTAFDTVRVDLSQYFTDDDGDQLTYSATSGSVFVSSVTGSILSIAGRARGQGTVTATARDPDGLSATQQASVNVRGTPGFLRVRLRYDEENIGAVVLLLSGPPADSIQAADGLAIYHAPGTGGVRALVVGEIPEDGTVFRFWAEDVGSPGDYRGTLEQAAGTDYRQRPAEAASVAIVR